MVVKSGLVHYGLPVAAGTLMEERVNFVLKDMNFIWKSCSVCFPFQDILSNPP